MSKADKFFKALATIASVALGISAVTGVYLYYRNHVWRPHVSVANINWDTGKADITIGVATPTTKTLYADSVLAVGSKWGVRFAKSSTQSTGYGRIELIKDNEVYSYLAQR